MHNFYGYMRVSSVDQNVERQRAELNAYGLLDTHIYYDKLSGKNFERPQYQQLKKQLYKGDVLVIKSLDRLGRNYIDVQEEWRDIVKVKHADIIVLDMPLLDTRTNKDLIGTLISDIVLQLLSYVAQAERENIRQRQAEGIALAKANGKHLGRIPKPIPQDFFPLYQRVLNKEISQAHAYRTLGVTRSAFKNMIRKYNLIHNHSE